jgi:hypothetical protein
LAPDANPRLYESNASWDVGCLFLLGDHLCYVGEETRFALRRDQVTDLQLTASLPDWSRPKAVCLRWQGEDESSGAFTLKPLRAQSMRELRRDTSRLREELQSWRNNPPRQEPPAPLAGLEALRIGEVSSQSPRAAVKPARVVATMILIGLAALGVAALFGLPVNLAETIAQGLTRLLGFSEVIEPVASPGRYVVAVALLTTLFLQAPLFLYREPQS